MTTSRVNPEELPRDAPPLFSRDRGDTPVRGYEIIGSHYEHLFGVDSAGQVWLVDPDGEEPPVFVNGSVQQFASAVKIFEPAWRAMGPDEVVVDQIVQITAAFEQIDQAALADAGTFWSVVLEQVEDGLF